MSSSVDHAPLGAVRLRREWWSTAALLSFATIVFVVLLERLPTIRFAYLNVDESAYLAVGEGLLRGAMPYVDIIDRKPVGLYLIYALAAAIFPDPIVGARILGLVGTVVSASVIATIGRRFLALPRAGATLAGVLFSVYAICYGGDAAQYNVFVMPFVAAAALIVFEAADRLRSGQAPSPAVLGFAGLLLGTAMQVKYTAAFEAIGFGGLLIVLTWREHILLGAAGRARMIAGLLLMIAGGLAPTAAAAATYWQLGHFAEFVFYNFTVNLVRPGTDYPPSMMWGRIAEVVAIATPLLILPLRNVALALRTPAKIPAQRAWGHVLLAVWFGAALAGALMQRQPYLHYFYAIVPPLALWTAVAFCEGAPVRHGVATRAGMAGLILLPLVGYAGGWAYEDAAHGSFMLPRQIGQDLKSEGVRSLYIFNSFGIIYHLSGVNAPTRYTLPTHLLRDLEAASFEFDALAEVKRILASTPDVIVVTRPFAANIAPDRIETLDAALHNGYCTWRTYPAGRDLIYLYRFRGTVGEAARPCNEIVDARAASGAGGP